MRIEVQPHLVTCGCCTVQEWWSAAMRWQCRHCGSVSGTFEPRKAVAKRRMDAERDVAANAVAKDGDHLFNLSCVLVLAVASMWTSSMRQDVPVLWEVAASFFLSGSLVTSFALTAIRWRHARLRLRWLNEHPEATRAPWTPWDPMLDSTPSPMYPSADDWPPKAG